MDAPPLASTRRRRQVLTGLLTSGLAPDSNRLLWLNPGQVSSERSVTRRRARSKWNIMAILAASVSRD